MVTAVVEIEMKPESDSEQAFYFPQGLAGFSDAHEFGFVYEGHGDITCLQSIDRPEAAFLITPWDEKRLGPAPELPKEMCNCIHIEDQAQIMWMLVLNPFADKEWVTANLRAPIALNVEARKGVQCICQDTELELRYRWMRQPS